MQEQTSSMFEPTEFLDNERLRFDRCCRFLVCATERPGSIFEKFGLLGRLQRIGWQAGRSKDDIEGEVWERYNGYLDLMCRDPASFWLVTDRLIACYGREQLSRWNVLKSRAA